MQASARKTTISPLRHYGTQPCAPAGVSPFLSLPNITTNPLFSLAASAVFKIAAKLASSFYFTLSPITTRIYYNRPASIGATYPVDFMGVSALFGRTFVSAAPQPHHIDGGNDGRADAL